MKFGIRQETLGNRTEKGMNRKIIICLLTGCLMSIAVFAEAQQPKRVARIGYLSAVDPATESARAETIRLALGELGQVEGQTITIEYRYGEAKPTRAPEIAAEMVRLKVDVIVVAGGGGWVEAAKNATKTIPIVMVGPGVDPIEAGFADEV